MTIQKSHDILDVLKTRFDLHPTRHKGIMWVDVLSKLNANPHALDVIRDMEMTGGEPDVIGQENGCFLICDCSAESPTGRRSLCYDDEALASRKLHKPSSSAAQVAQTMGIELLTETQYRELQKLGQFDLKTSSWIKTPHEIRSLGGALFCDRRYGQVFVYHNGAESYYAARGFRGMFWL